MKWETVYDLLDEKGNTVLTETQTWTMREQDGKGPTRWLGFDVGMQIEGRKDWAHIAILDHPENKGFPQCWRVDGQLGIGPARARMADWQIPKGKLKVIKYQLVVYTGTFNDVTMNSIWSAYSGQDMMYSIGALRKPKTETPCF